MTSLWLIVLIGIKPISAQEISSNKFFLELEPLQFVNNGWSVVAHYALNDRWQIGANVFASELSEGMNDFVFDIQGDVQFLAKQNVGLNISPRFFLQQKESQEGWVVSLPLGWETWTLSDQNSAEEIDYSFWYLSPRIGYLWYPFSAKRFYLLGEAVMILPIFRDDATTLSDASVEVNSLIPIPGLGIGLSF